MAHSAKKNGSSLISALCVLVLLASVLPLYGISFYNHPYYDDYGFSAGVHSVWQETGSLSAVLKEAFRSAASVRANWQGTYTGTLLSNVQPGVFSESLYFIGTFLLLTAFLLCFWVFFRVVFGAKGLGLCRRETAMLSCLTLSLLVQLMPDTGEAFFWFNGGIGNVFIYGLLALSAALLLLLVKEPKTGKVPLYTVLLACLMVLLGGGSYGGGLFGLCGLALATLWLFVRRHSRKWHFLGLWLLFLGCFLYSMTAPGNSVRAAAVGYQGSAVKSVLQALFYGTAQMGTYLRLPVIGLSLVLLPCFARRAAKSRFSFSHPWWVLVLLGGLYCTQLVPPLYSIASIGAGRIVNTYWISFVVLWLLYLYYLTGYAVKHCASLQALPGESAAAKQPVQEQKEALAEDSNEAAEKPLRETSVFSVRKLRRGLALAGVCLTVIGCFGQKQEDNPLYGPQNLAGVSAAISLLNGEAAEYDRQMTVREQLLNDAALDVVELTPLTVNPDVFMDDLIVPHALYDVRPSLCEYYGKTAITIAGEGAEP